MDYVNLSTTSFWKRASHSKITSVKCSSIDLISEVLDANPRRPEGGVMCFTDDVVDAAGRFRLVEVKDVLYVAKRTHLSLAKAEVRNSLTAREVAKVTPQIAGLHIDVAVPSISLSSDMSSCWLVTRFCGLSAQQLPYDLGSSRDVYIMLRNKFTSSGLQWGGCAPRNIMVDKEGGYLTLIDFEDLSVSPNPLINRLERNVHLYSWGQYCLSTKRDFDPIRASDAAAEPDILEFEELWLEAFAIGDGKSISYVRDSVYDTFYSLYELSKGRSVTPLFLYRTLADLFGAKTALSYMNSVLRGSRSVEEVTEEKYQEVVDFVRTQTIR